MAHDFGAMKLTAVFAPDRSYTIDVVVDLELLPASVQRPGSSTAATEAAEVAAFRDRFLAATHICFDGAPAVAHLVDAPDQPTGPSQGIAGSPTLAFRLVGEAPRGARSFTWSHDWPGTECFLRLSRAGEEDSVVDWIKGKAASPAFDLNLPAPHATRAGVMLQYVGLGYTHIVPEGLDHILFVLGLFLLSFKARPLLAQITAFTIAHSITLALSMYGVVSLPASIVEPMIALSIAYVAIENIWVRSFKPWRIAIVFAFGLLHGLGFAGVLREMGLPRAEFLPALVSFNVGVELGQLSVVAAAFAAVGLWFGRRSWYRAGIVIPASCAIAIVGVFWTFQRFLV